MSGVDAFREAARSLPQGDTGADAVVGRAMVEVTVAGRSEWVTVTMQDGEVRAVASDGATDGPHVDAALRLLSGAAGGAEPEGERASSPRSLFPPPASTGSTTARPSHHDISCALEDIVTAVVRVGAAQAGDSASVQDALGELRNLAGDSPAMGIAHFIGRLRDALHARDPIGLALLLDGASRVARALGAESTNAEERERIAVWGLAEGGPTEQTRSGLRLVELGRERVSGLNPRSVERRYLFDIASGEVFVEERRVGSPGSLGTVGRVVEGALCRVTPGPSPVRLQLLQYEVAPEPSPAQFAAITQHAETDLPTLRKRVQEALKRYPVQASPFVVVALEGWELEAKRPSLVVGGSRLPLVDDPPGLDALLLARDEAPIWMSGRILATEDGLALAPFAMGASVGIEGALPRDSEPPPPARVIRLR